MNGPNSKAPLVPSLLDRLIEPRDSEADDTFPRGQSIRELEEAVRRDLQDLLNTRRTAVDGFPDDSELASSLLAFGLPELTGFDPTVPHQRRTLQEIIERTILRFEPRLKDVHVTSMSADSAGRGLRMSVEALLRVSPAPVPVTFDTVIKPGSEEWQVVQSGAK
jgi:type VI secretion system protein ImpF